MSYFLVNRGLPDEIEVGADDYQERDGHFWFTGEGVGVVFSLVKERAATADRTTTVTKHAPRLRRGSGVVEASMKVGEWLASPPRRECRHVLPERPGPCR